MRPLEQPHAVINELAEDVLRLIELLRSARDTPSTALGHITEEIKGGYAGTGLCPSQGAAFGTVEWITPLSHQHLRKARLLLGCYAGCRGKTISWAFAVWSTVEVWVVYLPLKSQLRNWLNYRKATRFVIDLSGDVILTRPNVGVTALHITRLSSTPPTWTFDHGCRGGPVLLPAPNRTLSLDGRSGEIHFC